MTKTSARLRLSAPERRRRILDAAANAFAAQGYTVSVRKVSVSPNGVDVLPALCKMA